MFPQSYNPNETPYIETGYQGGYALHMSTSEDITSQEQVVQSPVPSEDEWEDISIRRSDDDAWEDISISGGTEDPWEDVSLMGDENEQWEYRPQAEGYLGSWIVSMTQQLQELPFASIVKSSIDRATAFVRFAAAFVPILLSLFKRRHNPIHEGDNIV